MICAYILYVARLSHSFHPKEWKQNKNTFKYLNTEIICQQKMLIKYVFQQEERSMVLKKENKCIDKYT